jgi:maleylpyruvate isomerase
MRLFAHYRSSASYRVRIALCHKDIPYEVVPVSILAGEQHSADHLTRNPLGQVPVLEVVEGNETAYLAQSIAIIEYLDERFPQPPLLPREALTRARVRELAEIVNAGIQPLQNTPILESVKSHGGDPLAWARHFVSRGLDALERRARATAGAFLVGDSPTLADVCLVPQLFAARRFGIPLENFTTLLRVEERCRSLPRWDRAHPDCQPDAAIRTH